jgi:hypothetical protein
MIDHKGFPMHTQRLLTSAAVLMAMTAAVSSAQSITSAHSGLLHYFDGSVSIDGKPVEYKVGKFSEIKENSVLSTGQGRAEILLTPGVYLRVGENTSIKMLDNRLLSTRVEFLSGSMILESDDPVASVKDPAVTVVYKDYQLQPMKFGIFEMTSDPAQMKVYRGQADAAAGVAKAAVKEGHMLVLSAALLTEKFDEKQVDDLYLWARDRGAALSAANMASARSLSANGYSQNNLYMGGMYPGLGFNSAYNGGWYLNSGLGMYAYMPYGGMFYSPFGYGLFSPGSIYNFYNPGGYYWSGAGGAPTAGFVSVPVASSVVRSANTAAGSGGRLTGGHPGISVPVAGSSNSSLATERAGAFSGALARAGGGGISAGNSGRFGSSNGGFSAGNNNSASSAFGGGSGGSSGGGGFSGGGGGASAGGGRVGGGGGGASAGGRAR